MLACCTSETAKVNVRDPITYFSGFIANAIFWLFSEITAEKGHCLKFSHLQFIDNNKLFFWHADCISMTVVIWQNESF